jgi:hypothetical protein
MEAAACVQPTSGYTYARREPEKTALFQVFQQHLLTFEQQWTDQADGRTLPKFVLNELHGFMACGILGRGFAHLYCKTCREHHVVAFSCKARAVCPSCLGRRMNEGALDLVDHVLPDVPLRQFVVTVPFPLRFPLAFDGALLGQVVRIFVDTVDGWYRRRHVDRGLPPGETGAVAVIQRANSDLRLNPHVHSIFLDGVYSADRDGKGLMFHPAPAPSQEEIESLVGKASKRILRFLQRRKVITLVTAPGDGEVTVVGDETMGEKDPLLARLLAAAAAGATNQRKPLRIVLDPDERPVGKGTLCAQTQGFNLHAATKVAANDTQGRLALCKYVLRPPLANDRLKILDNDNVRIQLKKPWSDGTTSIDLEPLALIARLAALVPPPRRHTTKYFGVLSSHAGSRSQVVPAATPAAPAEQDKPKKGPRYIRWSDLLRRVFGIEVVCSKCKNPLRLIALHKTEETAKKILTAMHLPTEVPQLHPARPPPTQRERSDEDWVN